MCIDKFAKMWYNTLTEREGYYTVCNIYTYILFIITIITIITIISIIVIILGYSPKHSKVNN